MIKLNTLPNVLFKPLKLNDIQFSETYGSLRGWYRYIDLDNSIIVNNLTQNILSSIAYLGNIRFTNNLYKCYSMVGTSFIYVLIFIKYTSNDTI